MSQVVKKVEQQQVNNPIQLEDRFEIYKMVDGEDADGNPIQFRQLKNVVTKKQLEEQKSRLQSQIDEIDVDLKSIKEL